MQVSGELTGTTGSDSSSSTISTSSDSSASSEDSSSDSCADSDASEDTSNDSDEVTATLISDEDGYATIDVNDSEDEYVSGKTATYNYTVSVYEDDDDLEVKVEDYSTSKKSQSISTMLKEASDYIGALEYDLADAYDAYLAAREKLKEELGDFREAIVYAEDVYLRVVNYDSDSDDYQSNDVTFRSKTTLKEKAKQVKADVQAEAKAQGYDADCETDEPEEDETEDTEENSEGTEENSKETQEDSEETQEEDAEETKAKKTETEETEGNETVETENESKANETSSTSTSSSSSVAKDYDENQKQNYSVSAFSKGVSNPDDDETASKYYILSKDTTVEVSLLEHSHKLPSSFRKASALNSLLSLG